MSKKWIVGTALTASAVTAVLFTAGVTGGTAQAAAPAAATNTAPRTTTPKASSAKKSTATASGAKASAVSAAATKRLAGAAANVISPEIVDVLATNATSGAAGTGIVLTSTGEVLTNYHVITGATQITATDIGTGRTYPATVVGYDAADDVAVLQLTRAYDLPTADLDTAEPSVGTTVVAVGNAEGEGGTPKWVSGTVTNDDRAVVATNEQGKSAESLTGMLQDTAGIVPGYSGGPLVNTAGEVVGIDTSGSFTSLTKPATAAYAIPIAKALSIVNEIVAGQGTTTITIG
ncbi:MAG TPA: trypsin-like peptidase domain-containing protein [Sporichthyaceae bacterium]|jgi:S1-C subfamily serine protease|nr:trypsin-like peptidase domain-containing protein [Sporichthyaceae bacterium]